MNQPPPKIHLIPDEYHIEWAGELKTGEGPTRLFYLEAQLAFDGETVDYVCSYRFDGDGTLVDHEIVRVGKRGECAPDAFKIAFQGRIDALGEHETKSIWIRPFKVLFDGHEFGLIPTQHDEVDGDWYVESMPGNTLSFYAPWEEGLYDT